MAIYALGDKVPDIHSDAYVHPAGIVIGDVTLAAGASVWPAAVLRGDDGAIRIGRDTSVQDGAVIHCTHELDTIVGAEAVIGHLVHLEGCVVEDRALVGNGAIVLHRAVIRTNALVGSNAVVPAGMEVPSGAMALGVPAKIRENAVRPEMIAEAMLTYVGRLPVYRSGLRRLD
ncbi:MAG: gamma carbonic anhydrase family protein [Actinobacteria bacterium]|nr:gamma carbonic anhydrase family protein [Actinomycetota bacterium]